MALAITPGSNCLLDALVRIAPGPWQHEVQWVTLSPGQILHQPHAARRYVYFPVTAVVSMLYVLSDGDTTELCVIGNEGVVGMSSLMSDRTTASCAIVQSGGKALRLSAALLQGEFAGKAAVAELLLRYTQALVVQLAQTAVCNRYHSIDEQLCRWILIILDRLPGNSIATTQDVVAAMLGVGRASVNLAAMQLQREGLITLSRGNVTVTNRRGVEARACECYAVINFEYSRLGAAFDAVAADRSAPTLRTDRDRLALLNLLGILDSPSEKVFDDIAASASQALSAPIAMISFLDKDRDWFKSFVGFDATESPADISFSDVFFDAPDNTVVVESTLDDARFSDHPLVRGMPFIRFFAAVRLTVHGHTLGTLCVYDFKERHLDLTQVHALESLASEIEDLLVVRRERRELSIEN